MTNAATVADSMEILKRLRCHGVSDRCCSAVINLHHAFTDLFGPVSLLSDQGCYIKLEWHGRDGFTVAAVMLGIDGITVSGHDYGRGFIDVNNVLSR